MPDMNGFQFAEAVRADPRTGDLPIIALSSVVSPEAIVLGPVELIDVDVGQERTLDPRAEHELRKRQRLHVAGKRLCRRRTILARPARN